MAAGLVWRIGYNGVLYGLDPATGRVRQQAAIGALANHFPTPSVGDGLLLVPGADKVVAFAAPAPGARSAATSPAQHPRCQAHTPPHHGSRRHDIASATSPRPPSARPW